MSTTAATSSSTMVKNLLKKPFALSPKRSKAPKAVVVAGAGDKSSPSTIIGTTSKQILATMPSLPFTMFGPAAPKTTTSSKGKMLTGQEIRNDSAHTASTASSSSLESSEHSLSLATPPASPLSSKGMATAPLSNGSNYSSTTTSAFEEILVRAAQDRCQMRLVLKNFVQRYTANDIALLKVALDSPKWIYVTFMDEVHGSNMRRWQYKKNGLCRMIMAVTQKRQIEVKFKSHVDLRAVVEDDDDDDDSNNSNTTNGLSAAAIVKALQEVEYDTDVVSLNLEGTLEYSHNMHTIRTALVALLSRKDRRWKGVSFGLLVLGRNNDDVECMEALQVVGAKFNIPISSSHTLGDDQ